MSVRLLVLLWISFSCGLSSKMQLGLLCGNYGTCDWIPNTLYTGCLPEDVSSLSFLYFDLSSHIVLSCTSVQVVYIENTELTCNKISTLFTTPRPISVEIGEIGRTSCVVSPYRTTEMDRGSTQEVEFSTLPTTENLQPSSTQGQASTLVVKVTSGSRPTVVTSEEMSTTGSTQSSSHDDGNAVPTGSRPTVVTSEEMSTTGSTQSSSHDDGNAVPTGSRPTVVTSEEMSTTGSTQSSSHDDGNAVSTGSRPTVVTSEEMSTTGSTQSSSHDDGNAVPTLAILIILSACSTAISVCCCLLLMCRVLVQRLARNRIRREHFKFFLLNAFTLIMLFDE